MFQRRAASSQRVHRGAVRGRAPKTGPSGRRRAHDGGAISAESSDYDRWIALQHSAGNQAVAGLLRERPEAEAPREPQPEAAPAITPAVEQPGGDAGGEAPAAVQQREMGSGLDDPLYMADRRWSSGQGPDDRVTGRRLQNWAIARGSYVVRNDITLMRMQEQDGIEPQIINEIYWLLISLLRGEGPYDVENITFVGSGRSFEGLVGEETSLDKFEGSANAREMAVLELADHWDPIAYYFTRALQNRYRDSYLEALGRTPEGEDISLEDDPEVIRHIRHHPYDHIHTINQGLAGNVTFRAGQRYSPFYIADIYKILGSGSASSGTTWIYRDGYPLWYYRASLDRLNRLTVIGEIARSTAEAAALAGMLLPLAIKFAGFALSFSPNPFFMIAGVVLEEFGEEGLRDLNGQGRQFKDIASEAAREILINLVFAKLFGGGGEGAEASEAAAALERAAEKAAIKIRASVEKEIVRTEGYEVAKAVEAGEAHGVTDAQLIDEGFKYEVNIKHDGGAHTYRRTGSGEWCRWSTRICGLHGIEGEVNAVGGIEGAERRIQGEVLEPAAEGAGQHVAPGAGKPAMAAPSARVGRAQERVAETEASLAASRRKLEVARRDVETAEENLSNAEARANEPGGKAAVREAKSKVTAARNAASKQQRDISLAENYAANAARATEQIPVLEKQIAEVDRAIEEIYRKHGGVRPPTGSDEGFKLRNLEHDRVRLGNNLKDAVDSLSKNWVKELRAGTPGPGAVEKAVQNLKELPNELRVGDRAFDVTDPGRSVLTTVSPDHIYPVDKIIREPGFGRLTLAQQREVLELEENYMPMTVEANQSKGDFTMDEWFKAGKGTNIPLALRDALRKAEELGRDAVRKRIKELLGQ